MLRTLISSLFLLSNINGDEPDYMGYGWIDRELEAISSYYGNGGCSVSAYKGGELVYNYGTGEVEIDSENKVFRVASLSKNVAATSMLIALDKDVNGYGFTLDTTMGEVLAMDSNKLAIFQKFTTITANLDVITIRQLMSMGSGFRHYQTLDEYLWYPDGSDTSILEQYLSLFGNDPLLFTPGTKYFYSSFGYYIVTELVEVISGMDFYEYLNTEIFAALDLPDTGDMYSLDTTLFTNQYTRICDQLDRDYKFIASCDLNGTYSDVHFDEVVYYKKGAGNVLSTSADYAKYVDAMLWNRDGLVSQTMHDQMFMGQNLNKGTDWYGFGWHMVWDGTVGTTPNIYYHTGGAVGGVTVVRATMDIELVVTAFCDIQSGSVAAYLMISTLEDFFGDTWIMPSTTNMDPASTEHGSLNRKLEAISSFGANAGCSVSAYQDGELVYDYGTGQVDVTSDQKVFRVASLSKNVAATAMLIALSEDINGYGLTLDSSIADVLQYDPAKEAIFYSFSTIDEYKDIITIRMLMSMASGFRHYEALDEYLWFPDQNSTAPILQQYLDIFGNDNLTFTPPGSGYYYSSYGYYIVTELTEVIAGGVDWYDYLTEKIYIPLGLEYTGDMNTVSKTYDVFQYTRACQQLDKIYKYIAECSLNDTWSDEHYDEIVYYKKGAGNVLASSADYAKYIDATVWNRYGLVKDDALQMAQISPQNQNKGTDWYGFGWHMVWDGTVGTTPNIYYHTGGAVGGVTVVRVTMDAELVVTAFCDIQSGTSSAYGMISAVENEFNPTPAPTNKPTAAPTASTTGMTGSPSMAPTVEKVGNFGTQNKYNIGLLGLLGLISVFLI